MGNEKWDNKQDELKASQERMELITSERKALKRQVEDAALEMDERNRSFLAQLKAIQGQADAARAETEKLMSQLKNKELALNEHGRTLEDKERRIAELETLLATGKQEADTRSQEARDLNTECNKLRATVGCLESDIQTLGQEAERRHAQILEMQSQALRQEAEEGSRRLLEEQNQTIRKEAEERYDRAMQRKNQRHAEDLRLLSQDIFAAIGDVQTRSPQGSFLILRVYRVDQPTDPHFRFLTPEQADRGLKAMGRALLDKYDLYLGQECRKMVFNKKTSDSSHVYDAWMQQQVLTLVDRAETWDQGFISLAEWKDFKGLSDFNITSRSNRFLAISDLEDSAYNGQPNALARITEEPTDTECSASESDRRPPRRRQVLGKRK